MMQTTDGMECVKDWIRELISLLNLEYVYIEITEIYYKDAVTL